MCDNFLIKHHKNDLINILLDDNEYQHFSININFIVLFDDSPNLGNIVLREADNALKDLDEGVQIAQDQLLLELPTDEKNFLKKPNVHCRIYGLPICPELHRTIFPKNSDVSKFLQVSGTVVRISAPKLLEFKKEYICTKCKHITLCEAEYETKHIILPPKRCTNIENYCGGTKLTSTSDSIQSKFSKDYQEIKIQEQISQLGFGSVPSSMWVTLDNDLVDSCKPGDNITVCGILKRRWAPFTAGKKIEIELVIKANHVQINNTCGLPNLVTPEIEETFNQFWLKHAGAPVIGRDLILKSFCPEIFGLHIVKLAVAVVLAGGSQINQDFSTGVRTRSEPHLLLVGDPGTGKSQLLRFASKVIPRSVLTTGVGSTAAGLTVTAIMENGEWQLEGGALVLSDGGICCIDEFNSMKEHDKASIHEAMEQQSISVAKASIVCKLNTRCSILAATNPKGNIDPMQPLCMNLALPPPLLSRFDLVLLIRDSVDEERDYLVANYILQEPNDLSKFTKGQEWSLEMLQAYFTVIKRRHPPLTEESNRILSNYYQLQRRKSCRNKSRTTIRLLDSLVRLSQGHARLLFHEFVKIIDAVMAVILVEIGMGYQEESVLNLDINMHSFPENSLNNYINLINNVLKKLNLEDLIDQEMSFLQNATILENNTNVRAESKYFHEKNAKKKSVEIEETPNISQSENATKSNLSVEKSIFQDDNDDIDIDI